MTPNAPTSRDPSRSSSSTSHTTTPSHYPESIGGGEEAVAAVTEMLERVTELLDAQSSAAPRKSRKGLLKLLDRVETVCESGVSTRCTDWNVRR